MIKQFIVNTLGVRVTYLVLGMAVALAVSMLHPTVRRYFTTPEFIATVLIISFTPNEKGSL